MSKLAQIKGQMQEKVAQVKAQLAEKADKIPLVKKYQGARAARAARGPDPLALGTLYREGNLPTRLQIALIAGFAIASVYFTASATSKILRRLKPEAAQEKLGHEMAEGLAAVQHKAEEEAKVVSLGKFTTNAAGSSGEALVRVDIWLRVSNPTAAAYVDQNNDKLKDLAMDSLNAAYKSHVNFLSDEGKETVKASIIESFDKVLKEGKVEDVFFHNLVVE